jgi:hypothetical protein
MGDEAGVVKTSEAGASTGRGGVTAGLVPYLTLAEIGYFGLVVLSAVDFVLLAATMSVDYSRSIPSTVAGAILSLTISVAWFQLGRKIGNSWFLATGISGAASAVLGLAPSLGSGVNPSDLYIIVIEIQALVSLVYLVMQVVAFFSAARAFQVMLFRYAGYLFVTTFVVTFVVGAVGVVAIASGTSQNWATLGTYGVDYVLSAVTSMAAGIGFLRANGTFGLSNPSREA